MKEKAPFIQQKTLKQLIPNATPEALDLMEKLFTWDPSKRLTAKKMLEHKFFKEIYDPNHDDMVIEGGAVNYFDFEFE